MEIKAIRTEEDYRVALKEIEELFDAEPNTPGGDRLEALVTLVEAYEAQHYAIPLPDPIAAMEYYLESRGMSPQDLEPYIGSYALVSEVLNRKRSLTQEMIQNLEANLGIPAQVLSQKYKLSADVNVLLYEGWGREELTSMDKPARLLMASLGAGDAGGSDMPEDQLFEYPDPVVIRVNEQDADYEVVPVPAFPTLLPVVYARAAASGDQPRTDPCLERISL